MTQPGYGPQSGSASQAGYTSHAGYGDGRGPSPAGEPARKNTPGVISLIVGAAVSALPLLTQVATAAAIVGDGPVYIVGIVNAVGLVVIGFLALVALGFGIAGLLRKGAPKAAAAAGTALGAAALYSAGTAALTPLIFTAFGQ